MVEPVAAQLAVPLPDGRRLIVHEGGADRVIPLFHGRFLLARLPNAVLWERPREGHMSVLEALPVVLDWLLESTSLSRP